jgi:hypothetical protein
VARAAAREESHLAGHRRVLADDDLVLEVDPDEIGVRGAEAGKRLLDDVLRLVDELLHRVRNNAHV